MAKKTRTHYSPDDIAYMQSLSAAVVEKTPRYMILVILIIAMIFISLVIWMNWAEIDIIVRGQGKVVPSSRVKKIQSLEGGVVSEIFVKEGELVDIGQPLIKLNDLAFEGSYGENQVKVMELRSKIARLQAEAFNTKFKRDTEVDKLNKKVMDSEQSLYLSNQQQLHEKVTILKEQVKQKQSELAEVYNKIKQSKKNLQNIERQFTIRKRGYEKGIISEIEFLQVKADKDKIEGELDNLRVQVPKLKSAVTEAKKKIRQEVLDFQNKAKKDLNEAKAELSRIQQSQGALSDRVKRTTIRSPVKGTVTRLYINTIGGVASPGKDIMDIVPVDDTLLVEVRIRPADIADIAIGQKARIKFSAYDFSVYGSLEGIVYFISADTVTDEKGRSFFIVRIKPDKNYVGARSQGLVIRVGMTASVDILTSKRTIMQYFMKPIYKGMSNALGEK